MNMIEKLQLMMDERSLKVADVAKGANIPYTTVDGIFKKGYENIRKPTLKKLADFFGVSMEYLVTDEVTDRDYGKYVPNFQLTYEEQKLIIAWRKLTPELQTSMMKSIEIMGNTTIKSEEAATSEPVKSA